MIELPLIFIAGVLGSSHCIGMCGPFAVAIGGGSTSWGNNFVRQMLYSAGRIFTYAVFGAVAGYAGSRLAANVSWLQNIAALLAVFAGVLLIYQGAVSAGLIRNTWLTSAAPSCLASSFFGPLMRGKGWMGIFLAGLFTGMLPCGLVYGFVALAGSSGNLFAGAAIMTAFGAGTVPVMVGTGAGASLLSMKLRRRLYIAAAWCVMLTGALSIVRGAGFIEVPGWHVRTGCPACQAADNEKPGE